MPTMMTTAAEVQRAPARAFLWRNSYTHGGHTSIQRNLESTVASRITRTHMFPARSDRGRMRFIVCSEDHIERGGVGATQKYYVPTGLKSYNFEGGEPAAQIGDAFLDRSGEIYRRISS